MIIELPTPIQGATHGRIYRMREVPGGSVHMRLQLGSEVDGTFQPEESLRDVAMSAAGVEYRAMMGRARSRGAPNGEFRKADIVDFVLDEETDAAWRWV